MGITSIGTVAGEGMDQFVNAVALLMCRLQRHRVAPISLFFFAIICVITQCSAGSVQDVGHRTRLPPVYLESYALVNTCAPH
jgi:hypothetical protein